MVTWGIFRRNLSWLCEGISEKKSGGVPGTYLGGIPEINSGRISFEIPNGKLEILGKFMNKYLGKTLEELLRKFLGKFGEEFLREFRFKFPMKNLVKLLEECRETRKRNSEEILRKMFWETPWRNLLSNS